MNKKRITPHIYEKAAENISDEQCISFWRMVLIQAIEDATHGSGNIRKNALHWFIFEHESLNFVCENAQVSNTKAKQYVIDTLNKQDPELIDKILNKRKAPNIAPTYTPRDIKSVKAEPTLSLCYKNMEIKAYFFEDKIWVRADTLNNIFKFIESHNIGPSQLNGIINANDLRKIKFPRYTVVLIGVEGINQIIQWSNNHKLKAFAQLIENDNYKQHVIENTKTFDLDFKGNKITAWIYKNKLFFLLLDMHKAFFIEPDYRKHNPEEEDHFFLYRNTTKRQLLVKADLLLKIITEKQPSRKKLENKKPGLIQWIKQQIQTFEGGLND